MINEQVKNLIYLPEKLGTISCGTAPRKNGDLFYIGEIISMLKRLKNNDEDMDNTQEAISLLIKYMEE